MAKSSKRRSKSNMRRKLSTKELRSVSKHSKRTRASNKKKSSRSKKRSSKKRSSKKRSSKKRKSRSKSSRRLNGGDGFSVNVSKKPIGGLSVIDRYDSCVAPTVNNFNMRN